ncbi:hypothetical protein D4Z93_09290 [Clostridium fermenticellae]|uniref:Uncharacterized protein n=1 Tax=Clostridium fermenticellae TaxID=2068654 RepID=A0A386H5A3_9CLOT|nr:hypothetical protein [Clostridium fermenticellae]AYD40713.1 hypothetical protein D4Z93_09290 [Clostridium fermenticellae]
MDFRLDKVDRELRERIQKTTSTGKVHIKSGVVINKDAKNKKESNPQDFYGELKKYQNKDDTKKKKIILVSAVKTDDLNVPAYKEDKDTELKTDFRGNILDVKK